MGRLASTEYMKATHPEAKEADDGNATDKPLIREIMISDVKLKRCFGPSTTAITVIFVAIGNSLT